MVEEKFPFENRTRLEIVSKKRKMSNKKIWKRRNKRNLRNKINTEENNIPPLCTSATVTQLPAQGLLKDKEEEEAVNLLKDKEEEGAINVITPDLEIVPPPTLPQSLHKEKEDGETEEEEENNILTPDLETCLNIEERPAADLKPLRRFISFKSAERYSQQQFFPVNNKFQEMRQTKLDTVKQLATELRQKENERLFKEREQRWKEKYEKKKVEEEKHKIDGFVTKVETPVAPIVNTAFFGVLGDLGLCYSDSDDENDCYV